MHLPRNYVDRTWNYGLITVHAPFLAIGPNQKSLSNYCMESPESLTRDEKFWEMCSMEFYQKILYLQVPHTALQKFYSDHCLKYFCEFPNNISFSFLLQKSTQSATIVLTLWIYRREDKLQSCILFWRDSKKGACTVINRLLARSVDIVAWPVQWRFAFCTSWKVSEVIQRSRRNNK